MFVLCHPTEENIFRNDVHASGFFKVSSLMNVDENVHCMLRNLEVGNASLLVFRSAFDAVQ